MRVAYEEWWLSDPSVLEKLSPNNYKVTAYYLPDEEGKPTDVYIFQGDRYIDKVERVETFNRVMAEQTDEDVAIFIDQQKRIAKFDKYIRDNAIERLCVTKPTQTDEQPKALELPVLESEPVEEVSYHVPDALESL